MSDRIQELVEEIRSKATQLRNQLDAAQSRNAELEDELKKVNSSVAAKEGELEALKLKYDDLQKNGLKEDTGVKVSTGHEISNEAIDELVKEIEYCITQLKK